MAFTVIAFTMMLWLLNRGRRSGKHDDSEAALVRMHLSWQERRKRWLNFVERKLKEIEGRRVGDVQASAIYDDADSLDGGDFFGDDPFEDFADGGNRFR